MTNGATCIYNCYNAGNIVSNYKYGANQKYSVLAGGKMTTSEIKSLISNGNLPSTDWKKSSNINNGYPHLSCFDDQTVWLRNSEINDGEPYLKDNEPK